MNGIPMLLFCPVCHGKHIDEGEFAEKNHHTHACQSCGMVWRPAIVATVGVEFLPGFKNYQEWKCNVCELINEGTAKNCTRYQCKGIRP